jgi:hypothetical protein
MEKYINKLRESSELRNKMILYFDSGSSFDPDKTFYTQYTDSDYGTDNVYIDVKTAELVWDGWDPEFKVVTVQTKKFVNQQVTDEKSFLAIHWEEVGDYYAIPKRLAKKEGL